MMRNCYQQNADLPRIAQGEQTREDDKSCCCCRCSLLCDASSRQCHGTLSCAVLLQTLRRPTSRSSARLMSRSISLDMSKCHHYYRCLCHHHLHQMTRITDDDRRRLYHRLHQLLSFVFVVCIHSIYSLFFIRAACVFQYGSKFMCYLLPHSYSLRTKRDSFQVLRMGAHSSADV